MYDLILNLKEAEQLSKVYHTNLYLDKKYVFNRYGDVISINSMNPKYPHFQYTNIPNLLYITVFYQNKVKHYVTELKHTYHMTNAERTETYNQYGSELATAFADGNDFESLTALISI